MERRSSEVFRTVVLRQGRTVITKRGPKAEFADFLFNLLKMFLSAISSTLPYILLPQKTAHGHFLDWLAFQEFGTNVMWMDGHLFCR
jgi:hypothetical protein